jgi:hypothetical protein
MAMATKKEDDAPQSEPQAEPTFLKEVATMATLAEEAIRKLRTEVHGDSFKFTDLDLSYLYPQTINSVEYLERLEPVVRDYLAQTARFGLDEKKDFRIGTPIEENTSNYEISATKWMKQVYTPRKDEIDARVEALSKDISDYANFRARDAAFALGTHSNDRNRFMTLAGKPELSLDAFLAGTLAELKTRFYETELPHPEDLAKLYELCFNAEVKQRGWERLDDEKLAQALAGENVPLEIFAKYTEREVKLLKKKEEEPTSEMKGKLRRIIGIFKGSTPPADTGTNLTMPASDFTARDYVEGSNYFRALQALRTSFANGECPVQPTITINGQTYVRPPTLYEVLTARVNDFNSKTNPNGTPRKDEDPLRLFRIYLDSCTGRHYHGRTTKFKLIPICPQLVALPALSQKNYLELSYANSEGEERDSINGEYNVNLSKREVLEHQDWLFVANGDRSLLGATFDILKSAQGGGNDWKGMAFYINVSPQNDELRPLCVDARGCQGSAGGRNDLHDRSRFLRRYS